MDPRLLLMCAAVRSRAEALELDLGARIARVNAEVMEHVIASGTDDEVLAALNAVQDPEQR